MLDLSGESCFKRPVASRLSLASKVSAQKMKDERKWQCVGSCMKEVGQKNDGLFTLKHIQSMDHIMASVE